MKSRVGYRFRAELILGTTGFVLTSLATPIRAQYVVSDLNSPSYTPTTGQSVSGGFQVGVGTVNNQPQALLWSNPSLPPTNLTPSGYSKAYALGVSGIQTAGEGVNASGKTVALLWTTAGPASAINLNPTISGSALPLSVANGNSGNQQVGYGITSSGGSIALLWNGSAASAVNLNPSGYSGSQAYGTSGTLQVGYANVSSGYSHAILWSGTAASAVDLHPRGSFLQSFAMAVSGNIEVGNAQPGNSNSSGPYQAFLWNGTSASAVNLNPSGFITSSALGISAVGEVGYGVNALGQQIAMLWHESASSYVNLSAYLPAGASNAEARGIDSAGNIIGYATVNGQTHAFLWQPGLPPSFTNQAQNATTLIGSSYRFTFTVVGNPSPTFSVTSGTLPPGLSLSSSGYVSGTPNHLGAYSCVVTASNGVAPLATQSYSLTVVPAPSMQISVVGSAAYADGYGSFGQVLQGQDGNFYNTALDGGSPSTGTFFEFSPGGTESLLRTFGDGSIPNDAQEPSGVIQSSGGSFYGTSSHGGSAGLGTVFKYSQGVTTILHSFGDGSITQDGSGASVPLVQGSDGSFYGITSYGGSSKNSGTIFNITPGGVFSVLHRFNDGTVVNDGTLPEAPLVKGSDGNFYGTTFQGTLAPYYAGTVFRITPQGVLTILHQFADGSVAGDGHGPTAPVVQGLDGNFYGTTLLGGTAAQGSIFKMTTQGSETLLHSLQDGTVGNDGLANGSQLGGLVQGPDGNFYGVTEYGGSAGLGTLYQITPQGAMLILHSFGDGSVSNDGKYPIDALTLGSDGNFYGMTAGGGVAGYGALFKFSLQSAPFITDNPPSIDGAAGTAYNFAFTALGSPAPSFSLTSGILPPGLTLSPSGVLSGVPVQSGTFSGTVTASNGIGTPATQTFSITIAGAPLDTPTMPPWGLILLAGSLVAFGAASSARQQIRRFPL